LFLSSARSAALQQQLGDACAEVGWGQVGVGVQVADQNGAPTGEVFDGAAVTTELQRAWAGTGHDSSVVMATGAIGTTDNGPDGAVVRDPAGQELSIPASVFYRPDA